MNEAERCADYSTALRDYQQNQEELAALRARLKRIGQNFVSLGNCLIMHPVTSALDNPSFLADTVNLFDMLKRYEDLAIEQVALKAELDRLKTSEAET
jgi:hypothetical protein